MKLYGKKEEALVEQNNYLSKKHVDILKSYSENLKQKYEKQFTDSSKYFELECSKMKQQVNWLSKELKMAKLARIHATQKKPVYSPGKYTENG